MLTKLDHVPQPVCDYAAQKLPCTKQEEEVEEEPWPFD